MSLYMLVTLPLSPGVTFRESRGLAFASNWLLYGALVYLSSRSLGFSLSLICISLFSSASMIRLPREACTLSM